MNDMEYVTACVECGDVGYEPTRHACGCGSNDVRVLSDGDVECQDCGTVYLDGE